MSNHRKHIIENCQDSENYAILFVNDAELTAELHYYSMFDRMTETKDSHKDLHNTLYLKALYYCNNFDICLMVY